MRRVVFERGGILYIYVRKKMTTMCREHVSETAVHVLREGEIVPVCPKLSERTLSQSTRHTVSRTQVVVKVSDVFLFLLLCVCFDMTFAVDWASNNNYLSVFKHVLCVRCCLNTCVTIDL